MTYTPPPRDPKAIPIRINLLSDTQTRPTPAMREAMARGDEYALLINQDFPGRRFLSAVLLVPWAIPYVANALMWKWIYDSNYGALNGLLYVIGGVSNAQVPPIEVAETALDSARSSIME